MHEPYIVGEKRLGLRRPQTFALRVIGTAEPEAQPVPATQPAPSTTAELAVPPEPAVPPDPEAQPAPDPPAAPYSPKRRWLPWPMLRPMLGPAWALGSPEPTGVALNFDLTVGAMVVATRSSRL